MWSRTIYEAVEHLRAWKLPDQSRFFKGLSHSTVVYWYERGANGELKRDADGHHILKELYAKILAQEVDLADYKRGSWHGKFRFATKYPALVNRLIAVFHAEREVGVMLQSNTMVGTSKGILHGSESSRI